MNILVLGGDKRLVYTYRYLKELYDTDIYANSLAGENTAFQKKYDIIVLGIPACNKSGNVSAPFSDEPITFEKAISMLRKNGMILGGMLCESFKNVLNENSITFSDYYLDEALILKNAVPSAEGALALGINCTPSSVYGSKILIMGYGRIGSILAKYLVALGADVNVFARSKEKRTLAAINGCNAIDCKELSESIGEFSLIYNTVPFAVLNDGILKNAKKGTVYIELASHKGYEADCEFLSSLEIINAPSLPAKTAPMTAGKIIADAVTDIIKNK